MKYVKLFEDFVKNYGEKISPSEFKKLTKLKKGQKVLYYGQEHEVLDSDGTVARLRNTDSGETTTVNLAMFNQKGAIVENEEMVEEGINDPGILKAFFMAGGPGSGKSYVANELFGFPKGATSSVSYATGLKLVNNDNAFEAGLKKAGLDVSKLAAYKGDPDLWQKTMDIRGRAKTLTKTMQANYIAGRLGQVIDGTGKDYNKIKRHRQLYSDLGYDTYMVFVNTSKEVALERNQQRDRKLPNKMVEQMWEDVQNNLGKFQKLFGSDKLIIVDNSEYDNESLLDQVEKEINKRLKTPVQNPKGKKWMQEMSQPYAKDKNRPA
jgi:predicted kinase